MQKQLEEPSMLMSSTMGAYAVGNNNMSNTPSGV